MKAGDYEVRLEHGGRDRKVLVHVPASAVGRGPVPLVLAFHGGLGTPDSIRRQSRLDTLADREGFVIGYPQGIGRFRDRMLTWNAGGCCGYAMRMGIDDVGFTLTILDEIGKGFDVDRSRTYALGFSNGGMLSYRLACEVPERFAAIAAVSATLTVDGPVPALPTPVMHVHGLADHNVQFEGGVGENTFSRTDYLPVREAVRFWIRANHCAPEPAQREDLGDCRIERYEPAAGAAGAPVVLITIPEGGHTWPGGVDISEHLNTGKLVQSVDASARIWAFLSQFKR